VYRPCSVRGSRPAYAARAAERDQNAGHHRAALVCNNTSDRPCVRMAVQRDSGARKQDRQGRQSDKPTGDVFHTSHDELCSDRSVSSIRVPHGSTRKVGLGLRPGKPFSAISKLVSATSCPTKYVCRLLTSKPM
jgi:hypothetical protein